MVKNCKGCRYRAYLGVLGWGCAYLLDTGQSRVAQMTPEQRKNRECPVRLEGIPPVRIERPKVHAYDVDRHPPRKRSMFYDSDRMLTLYDQGKSDAEIAAAMGCVKGTVMDWRHRKGLAPNVNRAKQKINYESVRRLYMAGLSDRMIAKTIGCSLPPIGRWRRREGLPPNQGRGKEADRRGPSGPPR